MSFFWARKTCVLSTELHKYITASSLGHHKMFHAVTLKAVAQLG